jgi:hypothetical protein
MSLPRSAVIWFGIGLIAVATSTTVLSVWTRRASIVLAAPSGQTVGRVEEICCTRTSGWPVVVVRDMSAGSVWWVQERGRLRNGNEFVAVAHFGNQSTPPGTPFEIVVLSLSNADEASHFSVGSTLKELPSGIACSEPVAVIRR